MRYVDPFASYRFIKRRNKIHKGKGKFCPEYLDYSFYCEAYTEIELNLNSKENSE